MTCTYQLDWMELGQGPSLINSTVCWIYCFADRVRNGPLRNGSCKTMVYVPQHAQQVTSDSRLSHLYMRIAKKGNKFACSSSKITLSFVIKVRILIFLWNIIFFSRDSISFSKRLNRRVFFKVRKNECINFTWFFFKDRKFIHWF